MRGVGPAHPLVGGGVRNNKLFLSRGLTAWGRGDYVGAYQRAKYLPALLHPASRARLLPLAALPTRGPEPTAEAGVAFVLGSARLLSTPAKSRGRLSVPGRPPCEAAATPCVGFDGVPTAHALGAFKKGGRTRLLDGGRVRGRPSAQRRSAVTHVAVLSRRWWCLR